MSGNVPAAAARDVPRQQVFHPSQADSLPVRLVPQIHANAPGLVNFVPRDHFSRELGQQAHPVPSQQEHDVAEADVISGGHIAQE